MDDGCISIMEPMEMLSIMIISMIIDYVSVTMTNALM